MDLALFRSSISLIQQSAPDGTRVFVHSIEDTIFENYLLAPNEDCQRDNLYINCLFLLFGTEWVFITNVNTSPTSAIINMYSSSNFKSQYPLDHRLKRIINHYFLQREHLYHYQVGHFSVHDPQSMLLSLLSFYTSTVNNRYFRADLLESEELTSLMIEHLNVSCSGGKMLDFDRSVFRDILERLSPVQSCEILTSEEVETQRIQEYLRRHPPRETRTPSPTPAARSNDIGDYYLSDSDDSDKRSVDMTKFDITPPPASPVRQVVFSKFFIGPKSSFPTTPILSAPTADRANTPISSPTVGLANTPILSSPTSKLLSENVTTTNSTPVQSSHVCSNVTSRSSKRLAPISESDLNTVLKKSDTTLTKKFKMQLKCYSQSCLTGGKGRVRKTSVHYHCSKCPTYRDKDFNRAIRHNISCKFGVQHSSVKSNQNIQTADKIHYPGNSPKVLNMDNDPPSNSETAQQTSSDQAKTPTNVPGDPLPPLPNLQKKENNVRVLGQVDGTRKTPQNNSAPNLENSHVHADNNNVRFFNSDIVECRKADAFCCKRKGRASIKHYHCTLCPKMYSHESRKRVEEHWAKCNKKQKLNNQNLGQGYRETLQSVLIHENIYLVERAAQGPDNPIHVLASRSGSTCTNSACQDLFNFESHNLNNAFHCNHIKACFENKHEPQPDLVKDVDSLNIDQFGPDAKEDIISFCQDAHKKGVPIIKQYIPEMKNESSTSRYIYYSIHSGSEKIKYYSRLNRVTVSFDRNTKSHKCSCHDTKKSCIHKKIAVLVSEKNASATAERPENSVDADAVHNAASMMRYVAQNKRVPFDVAELNLSETPISAFTPSETHCHYCESSELVPHQSHNRGFLFTLDRKYTNITVNTKRCDKCKLVYRYSDYSDGFFNFNNSSFFSLKLLELCLANWVYSNSLESILKTYSHVSKIDYNGLLILDAVKAYLALKDLKFEENMFCVRCGHYPVFLIYDVIRNVCFKVDPADVNKNDFYETFDGAYTACRDYSLARGFLDNKSPNYAANMKSFSVKLSVNLPPLICPQNDSGTHFYTRPLIENDRPVELRIPLERLEQMSATTKGKAEIRKICQKLKLETKGGISHQISRINLCENHGSCYSSIRKKFSNLIGKSGGVLRGICPHGIVYILKFIALPESVADYTQCMTSMKIPPSFNFSDMASLVALYTNKHYPDFFFPDGGRLDTPSNPESELLKTGERKTNFNFKTYCQTSIDIDEYNHNTVHPVSRLMGRWILFDRWHESNQNSLDRHLFSVDNTNLEGWINTSSCEQQNRKLGKERTFANVMDVNTHIKMLTFFTVFHNNATNKAFAEKQNKRTKQSCSVDSLGFLAMPSIDKSAVGVRLFDAPATNGLKSSMPLPVLQEISQEISALNSIIYIIAFSPIADAILSSQHFSVNDQSIKQLVEFVKGTQDYDQSSHLQASKRIFQGLDPTRSDPVSLLHMRFFELFRATNLLFAFNDVPTLNMGIALEKCIEGLERTVDYVFLTKRVKKYFFNGENSHFDIKIHNSFLKYVLIGFIRDEKSFVLFNNSPYEIVNTKMTLLTQEVFVSMSRSADTLIFKLYTPLTREPSADISAGKGESKPKIDVFDFDFGANDYKRKLTDTLQPRAKRQVGPGQIYRPPCKQWHGASDTGRLTLYSTQQKICDSSSAWYDDIIINSYAGMCQYHQRNTFIHQNTLLANAELRGGLQSVDQKFIQILNLNRAHWYCVSNALTYNRGEPEVVEIFDSVVDESRLATVDRLSRLLSYSILQLRPQTTCVRYVQTQVQNNSNDCGPYALGFLWALSKGHHPLQYDHLRGSLIRSKVRQTFNLNAFVAPCQTAVRNHPKKVIKSFKLDVLSNIFKFNAQDR